MRFAAGCRCYVHASEARTGPAALPAAASPRVAQHARRAAAAATRAAAHISPDSAVLARPRQCHGCHGGSMETSVVVEGPASLAAAASLLGPCRCRRRQLRLAHLPNAFQLPKHFTC